MLVTRLEKAIANTGVSFLAQIVTVGLALAQRMIFVRVLSAEYLGINGLFTNILQVLGLADLGMNTAMLYSLYRPVAENDTVKIASLILYFRRIYLFIALGVLCAGLCVLPFLEALVRLDRPLAHLHAYYLLFLTNTVFSYLFVFRTSLFIADQKQYVLKFWNILFRILIFILQTIILFAAGNYFFYVSAQIFATLVENITCNFVAYRRYPFLRQKTEPPAKTERREIFQNVKSLFVYKFCAVIQTNTDVILTSIFAGTLTVGYYSNYLLVVNAVTSVISMIYGSFKSSVGNLIASSEDTESTFFIFNVMEKMNFWIVGFCAVCLWILTRDFIKIAFGEEYLLDGFILGCVVANFYTSNIRQTIWTYRETTGIFTETKYITLVTASLNLALSVLFGKLRGLSGILFASVLARMLYAWWREPMILYRVCFKKSSGVYFVRYTANLIAALLACGATSLAVRAIPNFDPRGEFALKIVSCAVVPNVIFAVYILPTAEGKYLCARIGEMKVRVTRKIHGGCE